MRKLRPSTRSLITGSGTPRCAPRGSGCCRRLRPRSQISAAERGRYRFCSPPPDTRSSAKTSPRGWSKRRRRRR